MSLKNKNDIIRSVYIIEDDEESPSDNNINWSENNNNNNNNNESSEEKLDDDDEIVNLPKLTNKSKKKVIKKRTKKCNDDEGKKGDCEKNCNKDDKECIEEGVNDVMYEIIKDKKNKKCVKISVSLDIETSNNIINIEFIMSKEMCLKLANQLK